MSINRDMVRRLVQAAVSAAPKTPVVDIKTTMQDLFERAHKGDSSILKYNVNLLGYTDELGNTPLHYLVQNNTDPEVQHELLRNKFRGIIKKRNELGETPESLLMTPWTSENNPDIEETPEEAPEEIAKDAPQPSNYRKFEEMIAPGAHKTMRAIRRDRNKALQDKQRKNPAIIEPEYTPDDFERAPQQQAQAPQQSVQQDQAPQQTPQAPQQAAPSAPEEGFFPKKPSRTDLPAGAGAPGSVAPVMAMDRLLESVLKNPKVKSYLPPRDMKRLEKAKDFLSDSFRFASASDNSTEKEAAGLFNQDLFQKAQKFLQKGQPKPPKQGMDRLRDYLLKFTPYAKIFMQLPGEVVRKLQSVGLDAGPSLKMANVSDPFNYTVLHKQLEKKYEEGAPQSEIDALETALANYVREEDPTTEGISLEETLRDLYQRYLDATGKPTSGVLDGYTQKDLVSQMKSVLQGDDYPYMPGQSAVISDQQALKAAKDVYDSHSNMMRRRGPRGINPTPYHAQRALQGILNRRPSPKMAAMARRVVLAAHGYKDQVEKGIKVESEHTDLLKLFKDYLKKNSLKMPLSDRDFFKMIAEAHVDEIENYYDYLETMEKHAEKDANIERMSFLKCSGLEKRYEHINFTPPDSVASAAAKGLEYRQRSGRGGLSAQEAGEQGIGSGVQRAVNLSNKDKVSPSTIRRMKGFFSRHQKNKGIAPEYEDRPWMDRGYVAWLLWGGDPGRSWAEKIVTMMDTAEKEANIKRIIDRS